MKKSLCSVTELAMLRQLLAVWVLAITILSHRCYSKCEFKAIFNFGDSNSDTGGFYAAFPAQTSPFGTTYFKKPSGRATDGRLIVDFLAQALGLPFLSPYLQSIGSDFRHGVNYATLASTVLLPNTSLFVSGLSPFALPIQINQMKEFKLRVEEFHSSKTKGTDNLIMLVKFTNGVSVSILFDHMLPRLTNLPPSDVFGQSIYTFYIGQNDFTSNLASAGIAGVKQYLPQVVSVIASSIRELYTLGGRTFLVLNLAPVGCYPALLVELPHGKSDADEFGCLISYNKAAVEYNKMLKKTLARTRKSLPNANLIYVDTYSVLLELFQHPTLHGLKYGTKACCGYGGGAYNFDPRLYCGSHKQINGTTLSASACNDPYNYVSWDGIHATEAANKLTALAILKGSYSDPPFPLNKHCDLHPIG